MNVYVFPKPLPPGLWLASFVGGPLDGGWCIVTDVTEIRIPIFVSICEAISTEPAVVSPSMPEDRYVRIIADEPKRRAVFRHVRS